MGGLVINGAMKNESAFVVFVKPLPDSGLENNSKKIGGDLVAWQRP